MGFIRRFVALAVLIYSSLSPAAVQTPVDQSAGDAPATAAGRAPSPRAAAALPRVVRFSGALPRVGDASRSGVVTLTFTMYSEAQGGAPLWVETHNVTVDDSGRYTTLLGAGSGDGLPGGLFVRGEARWLGVRIAEEGGVEQSRVQLVSVPYAMAAADAQSLGGRPASDFQLTRTAAAATGDGTAPGVETSGTVTSTTNTVGRIAKFTALDTLGDSVLIESAGNIGIGTVPAFPLHILANSTSAALAVGQNNAAGFGLLVRSGNDATPAFLMNNAANSANKHIFWGNGDAAFGLGGGRIGIGTSGPAYPLHIEANNTSAAMTLVQNNVNGFAMLVRSGNDNTPAFLMNNAANSANRHIFYGSGDAYFALGGGNVGIGTSGPSQKLQVAGTIYSSSGGFRFPDNTVQTTAATGGGAGDITSVVAGNGLAGGATSGDATLNIKTCTEGQILKYVGTTWTCSTDATSAGGLTLPFSGSTSSASGAFAVTQSNSTLLAGDPTFTQAQTSIPAALAGNASAASNTSAGVAGFSVSPDGVGIIGWNNSATGDANAILGLTQSTTGKAIGGIALATTGATVGVEGESDSTSGKGLRGRANALTGNTIGVEGQVDSSAGTAIYGIAGAGSGSTLGVFGSALSPSGTGVKGHASAGSGATTGVRGEVNSPTGTAGLFIAQSAGTSGFLLRGHNGGPDLFKVDGMGTVFAAAYKDLAGNPIGGGGGGTVTNVATGTGLTGGPITTTGTIALNTTYTDGRYAQLTASNIFSGPQNSFGGNTVNPIVSVTQGGTSSAVQGLHTAGGIGVYGQSSTSIGVQGNTNAGPTTFAAAVRGVSTGSGGIGVYGQQNAATGATIGVKGSVLAATGIAGVFDNIGGGQILSGQVGGSEKFAVNNMGFITTKSVEGGSMASDTLSLPAAAFSGLSAKVTANGALDNSDGAASKGFQAVLLQSGVVISSLRICGRDFDSSGQIVAKLVRRARTASPFSAGDTIATAASGAAFFNDTAQCFTTADLNANFATISNSTHSYYVQVEMSGFLQVTSVEVVH